MGQAPLLSDVIKAIKNSNELWLRYWIENSLFTTKWWVLFTLAVVLYVVWRKTVDKSRLMEITIYGLLWIVVSELLDSFGTLYVLWIYPIKLLPIPTMFIFNIILIPFCFMTVYQHFRSWMSYIIAAVCLSAAVSFLLEPAASWFHYYELLRWRYIYSFPIYIIVSIVNRLLADKLKKIATQQS